MAIPLQARIVGKLRLDELRSTNPIAVGDKVELLLDDDGTASIQSVVPRTNYVLRQSPRKKHNVHLLAANVDQALLIVTMINPKPGFIDRFLMMTEPYNIPVIIAFNHATSMANRKSWNIIFTKPFTKHRLYRAPLFRSDR